ncbi:hypothetical protein GCM10010339_05770 [Streptomyces alanosinicus]|uniref:Uncharacterized protein n=1 Tax=Streptomyces alanosinicus TaxID=68171 RepID=A0A918YC71_9ACTN|nr:hypothetical protein GCM10010339_05770 [Streptomyces alanosinicus]
MFRGNPFGPHGSWRVTTRAPFRHHPSTPLHHHAHDTRPSTRATRPRGAATPKDHWSRLPLINLAFDVGTDRGTPDVPRTVASVSLRASAHDDKGGSLTQEIVRAAAVER